MRWKVLGLAVFAVVIAVFTLVNAETVTVNFLFRRVEVNLILVILVSILVGMVLMAGLWSTWAWRLRGERNALRRRAEALEAQLQEAVSSGDGPSPADSETSRSGSGQAAPDETGRE
ncbi:LapA family protein [Alicyclobacillus sp.]|uniref:LapA family protein n=1 Tax=Alicyclobacillus sp. TaxID=61169 RepID=UPI0025C504DF|nr:LapA family protein [Alicyclobacillus sp.]MCL6515697.1 LapA family protein [Alicyclobacillus sp.]